MADKYEAEYKRRHNWPDAPSGHIGKTEGEFSVCQFFSDDFHEYVRRYVSLNEAWEALGHYTSNPAAQIGMVVRVIVTDGGDYTTIEWKYGEGFTFPPDLVGKEWMPAP